MANEEKRKNENRSQKQGWDMPCCGGPSTAEMMANCCKSMSGADGRSSMMAGCMRVCRWFPLVPITLGLVLLLLGFYLDAEITRIWWMIIAGFVVLMGTFGLLMMSKIKRMCRGQE